MFRQRLNELRLKLHCIPAGPVLIKEGRHQEGQDKERRFFNRDTQVQRRPARPRRREGSGYGDYDTAEDCFDMAFVYSQTADGARFYLPGSSLRGVVRTSAERIIARWRPDLARQSDPFSNHAELQVQQQRNQHRSPDSTAIYRAAGPLDRCFGHTALRGRWVIADAWMSAKPPVPVVVRDGVGIDRATGAAHTNIKFQFEAVTGGVFATTLTLINYELWQLGLLAHVLAAIDGGTVRMGYGTRRGLGRMRLVVTSMDWRWYGRQPDQKAQQIIVPSLAALSQHVGLSTSDYGWYDADQSLSLPQALAQIEHTFFGSTVQLTPERDQPQDGIAGTNWQHALWEACANLLPPVLMDWKAHPEVNV